MCQIKKSFSFALIVIICLFIACSCSKQDSKKITEQSYPNKVVENSKIDSKYKNVAEQLSDDGIKEFYEMAKIPHVSGHIEAMRDYILNWGQKNNIKTFLDSSGCVIMDVPATNGCENYPKVILQAHFDMVGVSSDPNIDIINTPLDLVYDNDTGIIHSKDYKTTIGGDNGTGIVTLMEFAKNKDVVHGPLRLIYTYDEETTMEGAKKLSPEILDADNIINLDGFLAGQIIYASAGTYKTLLSKQYSLKPTNNTDTIEINIDGLKGGHSAIQITKAVINGNVLMRDIMTELNNNNIKFNLIEFSGGNAPNAIASNAKLKIAVVNQDKDKAIDIINNVIDNQKKEKSEDKDANFSVKVNGSNADALSYEDTNEFLNVYKLLPYGVQKMNEKEKEIPVTSINIGVVTFDNGKVSIMSHARSSEEAAINKLSDTYENIYKSYNYNFEVLNRYPAFEESEDKSLVNLAVDSYKNVLDVEAKAQAVHVGLESSWLYNKRPNARIITLGADGSAQHSVTESFYTKSFPHYFASLMYILEKINTI